MEQQALEWQQERDDFTKEIDRLNGQIRDKEKELHTYSLVVKEVCCKLLSMGTVWFRTRQTIH